ncbi:LuxR C-terminal-related transcriptional regulator [Pseudorhodoferax sp.]|uniref:LuxR C-terminal-related transcriptional regulator n=1 Tax=Pseudorhodoferax sp. TaxID=1993553 RepID=UPI0039E5CE51
MAETTDMEHAAADIRLQAYKLFPPPARPDTVVRRSIIEQVMRVGSAPLTVLQGPAGSGKSTTLQQIHDAFQAQGWATAWLVVDDADNDPQRFETQLHAMLASAGAKEAVALAPRAAGVGLIEWVLDALGRFDARVVLFLDDFQALHEPSILQFFRDLLRRLPARVRCFIGSRALPEIGLASLMVAGRATVLRAEDLRFSAGESQALFARGEAPIAAADEVELIHQRTEGWPAGLQLFRLAFANPAVRESLEELAAHGPRELAEYLSDNVVSMQQPQVREFLLRTSLLRRLSGPLCDAVLGRSGSHEVLRQLEHDGLFISALDASGTWFRYHGLFASYLRDGLVRADPEAVEAIHGLAARWHLAHGELEEAVYHAIEGGDMALAVQALDPWVERLISTAELVTAAHWYDRIGLEEAAQHRGLMIKMAWALIFLRRSAKLRPLLGMLRQQAEPGHVDHTTDPGVVLGMAALFEDDLPAAAARIARVPDIQHPDATGFAAFELGAAANLLAFHALGLGEVDVAHRMLVLARSHNDRADATFSTGYTMAVESMACMLAAQPRRVLRIRGTVAQRADRPTGAMASAALAACQIWASYEIDALDDVERLAEQFGDQIARGAVPDFIASALMAIARTHQARGRPDEAQATLDALDRIAFESGWSRLVCMVEWERIRLAALSGNVSRARAIAQRVAQPAPHADARWLPISELVEGPVLGRIRLALHGDDPGEAARLLQAAEPLCADRPLLRIKTAVLKALLLEQRGQNAAAQRSLLKALELAAPGECVRAFLDQGPRVVPLLVQAQHALAPGASSPEAGATHAFACRVLRAAGLQPDTGTAPSAPPGPAMPLSEREQHVLRLLCEGASNRDLATQLAVSENTVKFHLKNLYGKLGVGSRAQAISVAHGLLLPKP